MDDLLTAGSEVKQIDKTLRDRACRFRLGIVNMILVEKWFVVIQ